MKKYLLLFGIFFALPLVAQDLVLEEIPLEAPVADDSSSQQLNTQTISHGDGTLDDLYTLVEEQKKALRDITERLEQTEFRLKQTEEKLERTNQDLAFRVTELENKPAVTLDKNSDKERYEYAYNLLKKNDYKQSICGLIGLRIFCENVCKLSNCLLVLALNIIGFT